MIRLASHRLMLPVIVASLIGVSAPYGPNAFGLKAGLAGENAQPARFSCAEVRDWTADWIGSPLQSEAAIPWQLPDAGDVKQQALAWLQQQQADQQAFVKAEQLWEALTDTPTEDELLRSLAETFALADANVLGLLALCSEPKRELLLPSHPWLTDPNTPPLLANNMRLLYGRWLVQQFMFDEALQQIGDLKPDDVVAPALLLFCQGVANHTLLDKQNGLQSIQQLLDGAEHSPRRYVALARLMQQDLEGLQDETLDHIARRMNDVRRRLDLGRAGEKVRNIERGVIESLDKLIKKLEQQQRQRSGSGSSDNIRSSNPAPDSRIITGKGRGEVTKRSIGSQSGWGDLPPKQREEALQQIGRDFPAHYRDVIEQYFRRLSAEEDRQP